MKRAATVLRHYSEADATMRQQMRTMHAHFVSHQAAFEGFNPEFDTLFGEHWLTAIGTADDTLPGAVRVAELKEETAAVTDVMTQAQQAAQTLFYFVGRAFPHNAGRLDQYGRRDYVAARDNHDKMRTLLQTAFTSATRDHAALALKGYSANQLAALGTLADSLTDTNTSQEIKKGSNTEAQDHYVTVQNLAYGFGQEVSAAAKILFAGDAATLSLFQLTHTRTGPEHHELTVAPGKTRSVPFAFALTAEVQLHLRLFGPELGQLAEVSRVAVAGEVPTQAVSLTPAAPTRDVPVADLGPLGQVLVVRNAGQHPVRVEMVVLQ